MGGVSIRRLDAAEPHRARETFAMMAQVFDEEFVPPRIAYMERLLRRPDFWVFAALADDTVVGGVTAFSLPLTRAEQQELFLYDIAVHEDWRRKGIGRALVRTLLQAASAEGILEAFVLADDEDTHALDFYRAVGGSASPVTAFSFSGPPAFGHRSPYLSRT